MRKLKTCEGCGGACCKYVALEIDAPEDLDDFENIRWYVAHENVEVFVEDDGVWNIEFKTPCKYLNEEGKCSIHEEFVSNPTIERPKICKEFSVEQCNFHNKYTELCRFTRVEEVDKYIEEVFKKGLHVIASEEEIIE